MDPYRLDDQEQGGEVWLATPEHVDEVLDYTVLRETEGCDYDDEEQTHLPNGLT